MEWCCLGDAALAVTTDRSTKLSQLQRRLLPSLSLLLVLALLGGIGYRRVRSHFELPQAVLVLGGDKEREKFAAAFARKHPNLPIWVSSGSNPEYAEWVFLEANIALDRVHLDYRAIDTVTNFTTLADDLRAQGVHSVYLITSDDHMRRASLVGEIVLGSRGIHFRPVPVPSGRSPEPLEKALRDGLRAVLWVTTGRTGAGLAQQLRAQ